MSIAPLKLEETTGEVNETLTAVQNKLGMIPNMYAVLAKAPVVLNNALTVSENLKHGALDAKIGEQIAIAIADENACGYCLSAHTAIGKMVGVIDGDLSSAQSGQASDPKAQAAIDLALEINRTHGDGSAAAVAKALEAGLKQEVLEVANHVAANILTNTVNGLAETSIDFPEVALRRKAKAA